MKNFFLLIAAAAALLACRRTEADIPSAPPGAGPVEISPPGLARMFSELPLQSGNLHEVYDAVCHSSGRGYDEEYTMAELVSPSGGTKAGASYGTPLRELIRQYCEERMSAMTRSGGGAQAVLEALAASGYQLYWPYSDGWDGKTFPIITFDPGDGAETNYGYEISLGEDGTRIVDSVYVDESVALRRPVWVVNANSDSGFEPLESSLSGDSESFSLLVRSGAGKASAPEPKSAAGPGIEGMTAAAARAGTERAASPAPSGSRTRKLMLKSFKMLRNYDSWFGGASEFLIKCGSVNGFNASTDAELKLYTPTVTDFMIVVKRRLVGKDVPYDAILVSDFTSQLEKLAFVVVEDDGGTTTSWRCEAVVKISSKSYGFTLDIPYRDRDDIVWRGQLPTSFFFEEDVVESRFGDVVISFELI